MKFVKGWHSGISDALKTGRKILKKAKIRQAELESEILLSAAIQKPREFIYAHPEYALSRYEERVFADYVKRRAQRMPLAYISGFKEFYESAFFVNKNVLIPRPETERLVDLALIEIRALQEMGINNMDIIDVGTGSGAIIVSIAKTIAIAQHPIKDSRYKLQGARFYAVDSSKRALKIAQENAKRLGAASDIQFLHGHLLQPYFHATRANQQYHNIEISKYRIVLANLPYLTASEMKNLQPEVRYEPRQALDGGKDGLDVYREFFRQLEKLRDNPFTVICEIAPQQKNGLSKIIKASLPLSEIGFSKDFSGRIRFAAIKNPPRE